MIKFLLKDLRTNLLFYASRLMVIQIGLGLFGSLILNQIFQLLLKITGQSQLSISNVTDFLLNPMSMLIIMIYVICLVGLISVEFLLTINLIRGKSFFIEKKGVKEILPKLKRQVSLKEPLIFLAYLILNVPVANLFLTSLFTEQLYIPNFIVAELLKSTSTAILYVGLMALIFYLNYRFVYTIPLYVCSDDLTFYQSLKESWRRTRKGLFKTLVSLIKLFGIVFLAFVLYLIVITLLFTFVSVFFVDGYSILVESIYFTFFLSGILIYQLLSKLILLDYLLYRLSIPIKEKKDYPSPRQKWLAYGRMMTVVMVISALFIGMNIERLTTKNEKKVEIIAHRGDVNKGVENSIEALQAASEAKADYVEMDIIMTKDNEFVVVHDNDLTRLTGLNQLVSESYLKDVAGLTIRQEEFTSQLVSFDDYVAYAKSLNMELLVELKPHGSEPDNYEEIVVQKLRDLGVTNDYKVFSLNLEVMEKIEKLAPEIETGHVIPLQIGNFESGEVDFYALEEFSYRPQLAWEARIRNKDLYVWTVSDRVGLLSYLDGEVNGLITDSTGLAYNLRYYLKENDTYYTKMFLFLLDQIRL